MAAATGYLARGRLASGYRGSSFRANVDRM